jgi:hypothetical protein
MHWVGVITNHARERYVERVLNPDKYGHLSGCHVESCQECVHLLHDLRNHIKMGRQYIDMGLRENISKAQNIKDPNFLEIIRKHYPQENNYQFLQYRQAIYVIIHPAKEPSPELLTVMTFDMIDGMVIQKASYNELGVYFDRWKRDVKSSDRKIKKL